MNKFAIKRFNNHQQAQQQQQQDCCVDLLNNKDEFSNQTSDENSIYDKIHLRVSDSGSIRFNDKLPKLNIYYICCLIFKERISF